jgi:hypothetical protein
LVASDRQGRARPIVLTQPAEVRRCARVRSCQEAEARRKPPGVRKTLG